MENKSKIFLTFALSVAFAVVLSYLVSFPPALFGFAPKYATLFSYLVGYGATFAVSIFAVIKSGIVERIVPNWATKTLAASVSLLLFLATLLLVGLLLGGTFAYSILIAAYFGSVAYYPIKILVIVVLLKILLSLKSTEDILQAEVVESKGRMLITVLGFAVFFQQLFPKLSGLSALMTIKFGVGLGLGSAKMIIFVLGWVVPLIVAYIFVKKTKMYDRITSDFAMKSLTVVTIINVIFQVAYGWSFSTSMLMSMSDLLLINAVAGVVKFLVNGVLAVCILKILLTLKPATHVD